LTDASHISAPRSRHWPLILASAAVGVALGGFATTVLTHVAIRTGWMIRAYEPVAAACGTFSLWTFVQRRDRVTGLVGILAALGAMLLGELFRLMMNQWADTSVLPPVNAPWLILEKVIRYAFGMYIGWYLVGRWDPNDERRARSDGTR
jgi:hypothetical protein